MGTSVVAEMILLVFVLTLSCMNFGDHYKKNIFILELAN